MQTQVPLQTHTYQHMRSAATCFVEAAFVVCSIRSPHITVLLFLSANLYCRNHYAPLSAVKKGRLL